MKISEKLASLNLISGTKVKCVFDESFNDILSTSISSPSEIMKEFWPRYNNTSRSLNGKVFEGLLATILYKHGVKPLYVEAMLSFVPNVEFDFVAYCRESGPLIFSAKTSLRERYKQADLEGMMVRQVHRRARSFLITLDTQAASLVNKKISNGQVLGLDDVIVATDTKFDALINDIKTLNFYQPEKVEVLKSKRLVL